MTVLREQDRIVGKALGRHGSSEVKHTGDGLMAAFPSVVGAIESAIQIQRRLSEAGESAHIRLRIGMAADEPVTERDDLFGAVVQVAARLAVGLSQRACSSRAPFATLPSARDSSSGSEAGST